MHWFLNAAIRDVSTCESGRTMRLLISACQQSIKPANIVANSRSAFRWKCKAADEAILLFTTADPTEQKCYGLEFLAFCSCL